MRRLLIILLLTLLPLQASWAAVCAYCPDQCAAESAQLASTDEAQTDDDCALCHMGSVGLPAFAAPSRMAFLPAGIILATTDATFVSSEGDRPERPNWMRAG